MMKTRLTAWTLALLALLPVPVLWASASKKYVSVPEVDWGRLVVYVRSHVVPQVNADTFHVYVCTDQVQHDVVRPYDATLGDFVKVLLFEGMRTDPTIEEAILSVTSEFRQRLPTLSESDRLRYRDLFWEELRKSETFLPHLRQIFKNAQQEGRLRCWNCEMDVGFRPSGLQ